MSELAVRGGEDPLCGGAGDSPARTFFIHRIFQCFLLGLELGLGFRMIFEAWIEVGFLMVSRPNNFFFGCV